MFKTGRLEKQDELFDLAEGAGFEPANLSVNGFQDRRHRPLGHPSIMMFFRLSFRPYGVIRSRPLI